MSKSNSILKILLVCVVVLITAFIVLEEFGIFSESGRTVTVSGDGLVTADSDVVCFSVRVTQNDLSSAAAVERVNEKIACALECLEGIQDINTSQLSVSERTKWEDGISIVIGYTATQILDVKLKDTERFSDIYSSLVQSDGISVYNVIYDVENKAQYVQEARKLAYEDAEAKAQCYAQYSGLKLRKALQITDSYSSYSPRVAEESYDAVMLTAAKSSGNGMNVPKGKIEISAGVNIVFALGNI